MKHKSGFSLVELLIAIAIMSVLLSLGIPAFNTYINNAKLRASAQSLLSGIQMARSEAVRRNINVDFLLTNDDVSAAGFATAVPNAAGKNWLIRTTDLSAYVEGKSGAEGSSRSTAAESPIAINDSNDDGVADAGAISTITFTSLGATSLAAAATFSVRNPSAGACAPAGLMRCLNIVVSIGGQARICDPAATTAGDTRAC